MSLDEAKELLELNRYVVVDPQTATEIWTAATVVNNWVEKNFEVKPEAIVRLMIMLQKGNLW